MAAAPFGRKLPGVSGSGLGIDWRSAKATGVVLIDLGAARPDVIERLVVVLRRGMRP
ncbi:hypothetical protein [Streptomyces sp. 1331.2]|uniref:hypothetical protein n=1 Tax=Streptomyces sp. 1331.2 TaxID=1938835 RepID=UPI0015CF482A|nr:hypothetical protein [Streptomyces sp. 1331.2]